MASHLAGSGDELRCGSGKVLRSLLRDCRRHKCLETNVAVNSAIRQGTMGAAATVKCWVFKA
ncbi:hypothetical protein [Stenotrophomonas rhizophila]|uniref:hypothetical protein n=1 Tax=Stenotrophomonas rhizophila TaxID=216778 RepID=UPI00163A05A5|nr:hypothetical protein [Stenotrophomonas rhizophila]